MRQQRQKSLFVPDPEPTPWERDDEADRLFAEVVFNRPVDEIFSYEVPYPLRDQIAPGKRVLAPFGRGNERLAGYCISLLDRSTRPGLKQLVGVLDDEVLLGPSMLELARWISQHYCCALGQALDGMLPAGVRAGVREREVLLLQLAPGVRDQLGTVVASPKQRGVLEALAASTEPLAATELARLAGCTLAPIRALLSRHLVESLRRPLQDLSWESEATGAAEPVELNADQQRVMHVIEATLSRGGFQAMLLHGVTGSGKTEVYLRAIEQVARAGREAIVLVPEISLTPQTIRRFRSRFAQVAVLHSHLGEAARHGQWRRITAGQAQVVIGARSAIFAPTRKLGLIVIDEEHEGTFKQETTPRYHARDVAMRRAEIEGIPLLLGSATPSLESWYRAQTGRCQLLELPDRVLSRPLPEVKLLDLRTESTKQRRRGSISLPLEHAMRRALQAGGQVILLLNRRGFSTQIQCRKCGQVAKCRRCDIALVFHRDRNVAICHYCDLETPPPRVCSNCQDPGVSFLGVGTERLELEVRAKFAGYACQRMDTDTMRGRGSHERVLAAFRRGDVRILLGTQMIAKGLDFPGVTLVGVISADTALHMPDFRAAERTFQLVAQVAGRTGRGEQGGRVLVQTLSPDHAAIQAAARHDFPAFAAAELPLRQERNYPPYGCMARVIVRSKVEAMAQQYVSALGRRLVELARSHDADLRILGPAPCPVTRAKNYFRYHLQLQAARDFPLSQLLRPAIADVPPTRQVEIAIDVDPLGML